MSYDIQEAKRLFTEYQELENVRPTYETLKKDMCCMRDLAMDLLKDRAHYSDQCASSNEYILKQDAAIKKHSHIVNEMAERIQQKQTLITKFGNIISHVKIIVDGFWLKLFAQIKNLKKELALYDQLEERFNGTEKEEKEELPNN